jgi:hypothetical protein
MTCSPMPSYRIGDILNVSLEEKVRRNAGFLKLIDEWLADESGHDERGLPELERGLDENRKYSGYLRSLFPEGGER